VDSRIVGDHENSLTGVQIEGVRRILPKISTKVVYVEDIDNANDKEVELAHLLKDNGIELLIRLSNNTGKNTIGTGYLLLGPKRSGNLYSKQDLRVLEIIANELVIAIENTLRFEEIEQFSLTLQKKVNDATKELRKSNDKLKALDEAKDEFISMASHQLRTPLTSVKGYLSMLAEGDAGDLNETQKKFIDQAFISSQRMVYLIADLLNVSRLKTGKFIIEPTDLYLPDVIDSEISQLNETIKSRGLTMVFNKPKDFPMMKLDETKLRQVIMNFTDNAIYYTPAGGTITVDLKRVGESAEFTVTDTGIGVPKSEQPHLFTKFYRAGNARKARPDGTGLGLFMAKKVIVASGGSIIFKTTEGKGSTFGFRFTIPKS
jgi:signal transduction histidine kinase